MKSLLRNLVARIPGVRFWVAKRIFLGPHHSTHRLWGVFPSLAVAQAHIPKNFKQGSDETKLFQEFYEAVRDSDLPVVRILSGLMPEIKTLFDLGGNNGICFYQYRSQIAYPPALRWMVCDVPSVNEAGRKMALQRGETQLVFTDHPEDANGADVYLSTGTLQYLETPFAEILGKLNDRPRHVLVNRIPMTEGTSFFALQYTGHNIHPYSITNRDVFVASVEALGYKLVDQWKDNRTCDIILRPDRQVRHYYGFYFVRA